MKTVPLFEVIHMVRDTDKADVLIDGIIQDQVAKGLHALGQSLLDEFARASGSWSTEERRAWKDSPDAEEIRERINHYLYQTFRAY